MTTDITELVQREKFEAWFKSSFHPDKTGPYIKDQLYFAWKAAGAELVEALEKAQAENTAGVAGMAESYETTISMLRSRIAELESRTVKLPAERFCPAEYAGSQLWSETEVWNKAITACADALRAAGIKVEAE
ncbi:TPA: hypothetical protein ACXRZ7_001847 [Klebsiella variicola subsp. variicola]|uniref:hypothetical protein n=1 Tax=Klebsiella variicola TaxID=244366 RepID=UPI000D743110|nr:hypothetical protein [Klebsiella variicola]PXM37800.1 hypothetical protein DMT30_08390 [Klebsiella variicola]TMY63544.1 hypothetical protein EMH47_12795 [Klebsiella pneumoniae]